jgi:hypothetical protein
VVSDKFQGAGLRIFTLFFSCRADKADFGDFDAQTEQFHPLVVSNCALTPICPLDGADFFDEFLMFRFLSACFSNRVTLVESLVEPHRFFDAFFMLWARFFSPFAPLLLSFAHDDQEIRWLKPAPGKASIQQPIQT